MLIVITLSSRFVSKKYYIRKGIRQKYIEKFTKVHSQNPLCVHTCSNIIKCRNHNVFKVHKYLTKLFFSLLLRALTCTELIGTNRTDLLPAATMASLRLMFLVLTLSSSITSDTTTGADANDDRINTILSYMVRMSNYMKLLSQKVDGVQEEVKDVARVEELTSEHLLKLEDKVADVIDKQERIEKKVEKVDRDVFVASVTWTFISNGVQGTTDDQVSISDLTLGQCIEYCQRHRESAGSEWNGLVYKASTCWCGCDKNSRGIRTAGWNGYVLYRVV